MADTDRRGNGTVNQRDPLKFFAKLKWLDGSPLPQIVEPYRERILREGLFNFDADGRPKYNLVLTGRAKKNWKTADLIFAALYRCSLGKALAGTNVTFSRMMRIKQAMIWSWQRRSLQ